jgi:hypothetical protein
MTEAGADSSFALTYEIQSADLEELLIAHVGRKRIRVLRVRLSVSLATWALITAAFTAITVIVDLPSVVQGSTGAPGWLYVVDIVIWFVFAGVVRVMWRQSPRRVVRRHWRGRAGLEGSQHVEVDARGVTSTGPDGSARFTPWTALASVRETDNAFHLVDHRGRVRHLLLKRGLRSQDMIPALREFLGNSIGGRPSAGVPGSL